MDTNRNIDPIKVTNEENDVSKTADVSTRDESAPLLDGQPPPKHSESHSSEGSTDKPHSPEGSTVTPEGTNVQSHSLDGSSIKARPPNPGMGAGMPPAPDGGYGWVIVISSLVCNLMFAAMRVCFAVLITELTQYFDKSNAEIGLIASVDTLIACLMSRSKHNIHFKCSLL